MRIINVLSKMKITLQGYFYIYIYDNLNYQLLAAFIKNKTLTTDFAKLVVAK